MLKCTCVPVFLTMRKAPDHILFIKNWKLTQKLLTNSQRIEHISSEERNLRHQVKNTFVAFYCREKRRGGRQSQNEFLRGLFKKYSWRLIRLSSRQENKRIVWVTSLHRWDGRGPRAGWHPTLCTCSNSFPFLSSPHFWNIFFFWTTKVLS